MCFGLVRVGGGRGGDRTLAGFLLCVRRGGLCSPSSSSLDLPNFVALLPFCFFLSLSLSLSLVSFPPVPQAITSGLIEAKLDQLSQTAKVQRSAGRVFTQSQWGQLSKQLHAWRDNVKELMSAVEAAKGRGETMLSRAPGPKPQVPA